MSDSETEKGDGTPQQPAVETPREPAIRVALADFPLFDGTAPLEPFIQQCQRLMALGGLATTQLSGVLAARCRGLALQVVEGADISADVTALLRESFAAATPATAAAQLSTARKGSQSAIQYSLLITRLVREACPEFFDRAGQVKKICVPAHQSALYRHFLVGLSQEEKTLLSRQGAKTFKAAVDELRREEEVSQLADVQPRPGVHWAEFTGVSAGSGERASSSPPTSRRASGFGMASDARPQRYRSPSPYESARSARAAQAGAEWRQRGESPVPARSSAGSSSWRAGGAGAPGPRRAARDRSWSPGREDARPATDEGRRQRRCWICSSSTHLKRDCPNGQPGRRGGEW